MTRPLTPVLDRIAGPSDLKALSDADLRRLEQGAQGGFGAMVLHHLANAGLLDGGVALRTMTLPGRVIDHAAPEAIYRAAGLSRADIVRTVRDTHARRSGRVVRLAPVGG